MIDHLQHFFYNFPACEPEATEEAQLAHIRSEVEECAAETDSRGKALEAMDAIHCLETFIRKLSLSYAELDRIKAEVVRKNYERGYYGPTLD